LPATQVREAHIIEWKDQSFDSGIGWTILVWFR